MRQILKSTRGKRGQCRAVNELESRERILKLDESCISNPKSEISNWTESNLRFRISDLKCMIRPISKFFPWIPIHSYPYTVPVFPLALPLVLLASNPATYVVVPIVLVLLTLAACYIPARRASLVDPVCSIEI